MNPIIKIAASILAIPYAIGKQIAAGVVEIDKANEAQKAAMAQPQLLQQFSQEDLDLLAAMKKAKR